MSYFASDAILILAIINKFSKIFFGDWKTGWCGQKSEPACIASASAAFAAAHDHDKSD
jgi:hypothetical protein